MRKKIKMKNRRYQLKAIKEAEKQNIVMSFSKERTTKYENARIYEELEKINFLLHRKRNIYVKFRFNY